jgi:CPA1 family monovalent cation:H+ antiporter
VEAGIAVLVGALLVVAGAAAIGPRLRIPAPLILVVVGVALSALPFVDVTVPPELVLNGILPPLLYASSVSMPAMDLRREFGTISSLSVVLVVLSALVLGWLFTLLIPGLDYAWGVALGAVVSPTDAVATAIVKKADVSHRVTAILEGESLLNDASALVLLRAAVVAGVAVVASGSASVSVPVVAGQFVWSVLVAVVIGIVVGRLSVRLRSRVTDSTVNTVISFTVPFLASLPAELLGASGLVAAVAAGLSVGRHAPRSLSAEHRRSDRENWATVNLLLEGAIFLLMGLEISGIVNDAGGTGRSVAALPIALAGLAGVIVLRAAFVTPLLLLLRGGAKRRERFRQRLEEMQQVISEGGQPALERRRQEAQDQRRLRREGPQGDATAADGQEGAPPRPRRGPQGGAERRRPLRPITQRDFERFSKRVRQSLSDIDYLAASPLGPREGAIVVWAGMRGAVTVAAAQTLPLVGEHGPAQRDLLVLVAFGVAAISLLLQGGTLSLLIRLLKPQADDPEARAEEQQRVLQLIRDSTGTPAGEEGQERLRSMTMDERLARIRTSRNALLDARDEGVFSADVLGGALETLDAMELALDTRRQA